MTPYPEYKATNLPWLPQIPAHWEIVRAKQIFSPIDIRSEKGEEQLLSVSERYGVVKREHANVTMFQAASYEGYKLCWPDDLAINSLWAWSYGLGFSPYHGIISTAYSVFRLKDKTQCLPRFYDYFVRGKNFHWELRVRSKGLWKSRYQLSDDAFLAAPMLFAPINEQEQIVRYLDSMTAKINKLIRAKKKQIALLQEQKQAIINQAVTKGLNPDAEMKDSGIDWLGQIPAKWVVKPLKRVCKVNAGVGHLSKKLSDDALVTFLPMENISVDGKIDCSQKQPLKNVKTGFSAFAVNDVVVAKITPCFENGKGACLDNLDTEIGFGTTELIVLRSFSNQINSQYLYCITMLTSFRRNDAEVMTGSAGQKRVPASFIANFTCGIPSLEEQAEIVKYLSTQNALFEKLIAEVKKEIEVILEYKNSLIASVVTGQVDVRNIQVEDFDPTDLISETDDDPTEDDDQPQEESEE